MDKYIELAKKIKALADQGEGGEKENAQRMLDTLMQKHGIGKEELESNIRTLMPFIVQTAQDRLFSQIVYSVMGKDQDIRVHKRYRTHYFVNCTKFEAIEIESKFDFYWKAYKRQLDAFYMAFIQTNNIFPDDPTLLVGSKELSEKERELRARARRMAMGMEAEEFTKQLGSGK